MDSGVQRDGRVLGLIDDAWREDELPSEDVAIPLKERPEPERDRGGAAEPGKEEETKWTALALLYLHKNVPPERKLTPQTLKTGMHDGACYNSGCSMKVAMNKWLTVWMEIQMASNNEEKAGFKAK
ncbi:anaphase-promoting complex subunit 13-like [Pteronotus mesoamericanus]|uniref:anaphase-promoting complex subunit 13-like n=1 Tax=Pteronotus mesoamericanus TaxID=1884717 RepID=UPI0023ED2FDB|nr:anaphase-promoting complex subunit 13-like [Pteronotus parnellii mesoamericanus]